MNSTLESRLITNSETDPFRRFGVRRVVNCCGVYTDLGGSILSPSIWTAMERLNEAYVKLPELVDRTGEAIAKLVKAEAARVTPGASAALALSVAATMTGCNGTAWEQLPDTSGLKDQVLIASAHLPPYKYAVCARMSGATYKEFGPTDGFDINALASSVDGRTACVLVPAHLLDGFTGVAQLREVTAAAHAAGVPVVVDAAYMCDPVDLMQQYFDAGADLTCFSAKYFGGPNSGGFVSGKRELLDAVAGLDFTRFESGEYRSFGRAFKMGRYDIVATALALQEWFEMDHEERWRNYGDRVDRILNALPASLGAWHAEPKLFTMSEELVDCDRRNCVAISFQGNEAAALSVAARLGDNDPVVATVVMNDKIVIAVDALKDGEEQLVGECLRNQLLVLGQPS